jgi:hypothetical protein
MAQPAASIAREMLPLEVSIAQDENLRWLEAPNILHLRCDGADFETVRVLCQRLPSLQSITLIDAFWHIPQLPDPSTFFSVQNFHFLLQPIIGNIKYSIDVAHIYLTLLQALSNLSIVSDSDKVAFTHVTSLCLTDTVASARYLSNVAGTGVGRCA